MYQTAFGIDFSTSRQFAELTTADESEPSDPVFIEWGDVPRELQNPTSRHDWWQTTRHQYLLKVPSVASFLVTASTITVNPEHGAADAAVRLYLFGSVMGALMHLRGILPLHGSSVCLHRGGGAAAFTGPSSAGKSTLAAALSQRGYDLMADDICAVIVSTDRCLLRPGLARSKLCSKSSDFLQLDPAGGEAVWPDKNAFQMAISRQSAVITHVYELVTRSGDVEMDEVEGAEKLRLLDRETFRRNYIHGFGQEGPHLGRLARLAAQVRIRRIYRPPSEKLSVGGMMDLLERDWDE